MEEEIWLPIKGYENYLVSDLGNIKSLNYRRTGKSKVLKQCLNSGGYLNVGLCLNGKIKSANVHVLVAIAFLKHVPCGHKLVVNHKDLNHLNNRKDNLEIITNRENCSMKVKKCQCESVGVMPFKKGFMSQIHINKKTVYLGFYKTELEASDLNLYD